MIRSTAKWGVRALALFGAVVAIDLWRMWGKEQ